MPGRKRRRAQPVTETKPEFIPDPVYALPRIVRNPYLAAADPPNHSVTQSLKQAVNPLTAGLDLLAKQACEDETQSIKPLVSEDPLVREIESLQSDLVRLQDQVEHERELLEMEIKAAIQANGSPNEPAEQSCQTSKRAFECSDTEQSPYKRSNQLEWQPAKDLDMEPKTHDAVDRHQRELLQYFDNQSNTQSKRFMSEKCDRSDVSDMVTNDAQPVQTNETIKQLEKAINRATRQLKAKQAEYDRLMKQQKQFDAEIEQCRIDDILSAEMWQQQQELVHEIFRTASPSMSDDDEVMCTQPGFCMCNV